MNGDARSGLRDFCGLSDEDAARALLDLTLQAAPPEVADAVRACALPAWFDDGLLALLTGKDKQEAAALLEQVAALSFVLPRDGGGYVYHEATRARLLDWWREPQRRARFAALNERLAHRYLTLARKQRPRLSGPDYLDATAVMDAAYPNLHAAWEEISKLKHWELMRDFAYALHDYFLRRGLWTEWITWTQAGLAACEDIGDAESCAGMQNNLGNVYTQLPTGDRAENFQKAIDCYREALRVYTPEATPLDYAMTQNNLGLAYSDLPTGDRAENLQKAIACYREALRVYTPEAAPLAYAMTQNNLGNAYSDLPMGDRAENLQKAIACYREALRFRTPEAAPLDYAMTQNNLGNAYSDLPTGDRAENLERAIDCYREALRFRSPEAAPLDYAMTQNNLGVAYSDLPTGDRAENLEKAIACYATALQVEYLPPHREAMYHRNRAEVFIRLDRLDEAEQDCGRAQALAPDHPYTHARLGQLAFARGDYSTALEQCGDAIGRQPEADLYFGRGLAHLALGHLDQALADYRAGIPLAGAGAIAEALEQLDKFAVDHPDTPGLDAVRALFPSPL